MRYKPLGGKGNGIFTSGASFWEDLSGAWRGGGRLWAAQQGVGVRISTHGGFLGYSMGLLCCHCYVISSTIAVMNSQKHLPAWSDVSCIMNYSNWRIIWLYYVLISKKTAFSHQLPHTARILLFLYIHYFMTARTHHPFYQFEWCFLYILSIGQLKIMFFLLFLDHHFTPFFAILI